MPLEISLVIQNLNKIGKVKRKANNAEKEADEMVNNLQSFLSAMQNLTGDASSRDLALFCRKWIEEVSEKLSLSDAEKILNQMMPSKYALGHLCGLFSKITRLRADQEIVEFLEAIRHALPSFNRIQLHWAPDIYSLFFEKVVALLISKNHPEWGLRLLSDAILHFTGGRTGILTDLHPILFCLCLKARRFDVAQDFFELDVVELFKQATSMSSCPTDGNDDGNKVSSGSSENMGPHPGSHSFISNIQKSLFSNIQSFMAVSSSAPQLMPAGTKDDIPTQGNLLIKPRNVLLYFYYGAMIRCAMEKWEEGLQFLEHAICLPSSKPSAIVLEAYKKYVIVSLILGDLHPERSLPEYRSPNVQRIIFRLALTYTKLATVIQQSLKAKEDVVKALNDYVKSKKQIFQRDQNYGLVKTLINVWSENVIKRLGNVFVSLNIKDVARLAFLADQSQAEQKIKNLVKRGEIFVRIDGVTQTCQFKEKTPENDQVQTDEHALEVEEAMKKIIDLANSIRIIDDTLCQNPTYIAKSSKRDGRLAEGDGGSSAYDEDIFCGAGSGPE